jgi:hypothetical protein
MASVTVAIIKAALMLTNTVTKVAADTTLILTGILEVELTAEGIMGIHLIKKFILLVLLEVTVTTGTIIEAIVSELGFRRAEVNYHSKRTKTISGHSGVYCQLIGSDIQVELHEVLV